MNSPLGENYNSDGDLSDLFDEEVGEVKTEGLGDLFAQETETSVETSDSFDDFFKEETPDLGAFFTEETVESTETENVSNFDDFFTEETSVSPKEETENSAEETLSSFDDFFTEEPETLETNVLDTNTLDTEVAEVAVDDASSSFDDFFAEEPEIVSEVKEPEVIEDVKVEEVVKEARPRKAPPVLGVMVKPVKTFELKGKPIPERKVKATIDSKNDSNTRKKKVTVSEKTKVETIKTEKAPSEEAPVKETVLEVNSFEKTVVDSTPIENSTETSAVEEDVVSTQSIEENAVEATVVESNDVAENETVVSPVVADVTEAPESVLEPVTEHKIEEVTLEVTSEKEELKNETEEESATTSTPVLIEEVKETKTLPATEVIEVSEVPVDVSTNETELLEDSEDENTEDVLATAENVNLEASIVKPTETEAVFTAEVVEVETVKEAEAVVVVDVSEDVSEDVAAPESNVRVIEDVIKEAVEETPEETIEETVEDVIEPVDTFSEETHLPLNLIETLNLNASDVENAVEQAVEQVIEEAVEEVIHEIENHQNTESEDVPNVPEGANETMTTDNSSDANLPVKPRVSSHHPENKDAANNISDSLLKRAAAQRELEMQTRRYEKAQELWRHVDHILGVVITSPSIQKLIKSFELTHDRQKDADQYNSLVSLLGPELSTRGIAIPDAEERDLVLEMLYDEVMGISVLGPLWREDKVTEILVDAWNKISAEYDGVLIDTRYSFRSNEHARSVARDLAQRISDRVVSNSNPLVTAELPRARIQFAVGNIVKSGLSITMRKFRPLISFESLLYKYHSLDESMARFLKACVEGKANILVSGGTGTGKTTIINLLSGFIPNSERVVTIEDAFELELQNHHWVAMQTKEKSSADDEVSITLTDCLRATLRMRPDRIIVGEIRENAGAQVMIQAANTGHEGTMTTIHANSCSKAVNQRLAALLREDKGSSHEVVRETISSAFQLVVQVSRSRSRRYISEISVIDQSAVKDGSIAPEPIYTSRVEKDGSITFLRAQNLRSDTDLYNKLIDAGIDISEWEN